VALEGSPVHLGGRFEVRRVGPGVLVRGRASAEAPRTCDRCLADVRLTVEGPVSLYFDASGGPASEGARLHAEDLDVGFIEDGVLDLGQVLSEFLALEGPSRVRCGDPGVRREVDGECTMDPAGEGAEDGLDPRLAALRGVRTD
jgi:uncharacterized metal-binding protein YceD (DUF177 family)